MLRKNKYKEDIYVRIATQNKGSKGQIDKRDVLQEQRGRHMDAQTERNEGRSINRHRKKRC